MNFSKLLKLANLFFKQASEIKIGPKLLAEVTDFVQKEYCYQAAGFLGSKITQDNRREEFYQKIQELDNNWSAFEWMVSDLISYHRSGNTEEVDELLKKLLELVDSGHFYIPEIDMNRQDATGKWGVRLDNFGRNSVVFLNLEKNFGGKYNFGYSVQLSKRNWVEYSSDAKEFKTQYYEDWVSKEELIKGLESLHKKGDLAVPREYLEHLMDNWDYIGGTESKNLKLVYGTLKKLSHGATGVTEKKFFVDKDDLPYDTELYPRILHKTFVTVKLTNKQEAAAIHSTEDWTGLWDTRGMSPEEIGTLYIVADPVKDKDYFENLTSLNRLLLWLKSTTEHELRHFMQTLMKQLLEFKRRYTKDINFGYPKRENKKVDIYGRSIDPKKPSRSEFDIEEIKEHKLRDVEFYTRLGDEITIFNEIKKILPVYMHKDFARAWADDSYIPEFEQKVIDLFRKEKEKYYKKYEANLWDSFSEQSKKGRLNYEVNEKSHEVKNIMKYLEYENFFHALKRDRAPAPININIGSFAKGFGLDEDKKKFLEELQSKGFGDAVYDAVKYIRNNPDASLQNIKSNLLISSPSKYKKAVSEFFKGVGVN